MQLIEYDTQAVFADCKAILLMSRWRAIFVSEYMTVSASTPIQYSSTKTPLVENAHNKKGHFPVIAY